MRLFDSKKLYLWISLFIAPFLLNAQGLAKLEFNKEVHYFDTIPEEGGLVTADFQVFNKGNAVLRLIEVRASCGCTTEEWTREPISPGDSGYIRVFYDPSNRPGFFQKALYVESNDPEHLQSYLRIEGYVKPRPKTIEEVFPYQQGGLRFMQKQRTFGYTKPDTLLVDTFKLINAASYPVSETKLKSKYRERWYKTTLVPEKIDPGEKGKVVVRYLPAERKEWGLLFDNIYLATDDPEIPVKQLVVSLDIQFDFSGLSPEERRNAAELNVNNQTYRFGRVKAGELVNTTFRISNTGASELELLKISTSCDCIKLKLGKDTIKPGESTELMIEMDSKELKGPQHKAVTLVSNAPNNHQVILNIVGFVN